MAVFDKKLEGRQSIKGQEFQVVQRALEGLGVIRNAGSMIFLEPDWEARRFSGKAREGLATIDDRLEEWQPVLDCIAAAIDNGRREGGRA